MIGTPLAGNPCTMWVAALAVGAAALAACGGSDKGQSAITPGPSASVVVTATVAAPTAAPGAQTMIASSPTSVATPSPAAVALTATPAASNAQGGASAAAAICASNALAPVPFSASSPELTEISGLGVSRELPSYLWMHNDSGDSARVFARGGGEAPPVSYALDGVTAIDWEDMAIGPGPDPQHAYLYVGDIGDNGSARTEIAVYRVQEPDPAPLDGLGFTVPSIAFTTLRLRYPDHAHDAETLLVDPLTADIFIITKDIIGTTSGVFRAPSGADGSALAMLEHVADIPFGQFTPRMLPDDAPPFAKALGKIPTGGDISPAGDVIAIRTYGTVWIWSRAPGQSIADALAAQPCEGPSAIEPQGEAIAFEPDGGGYWTASEGANVPVHHFRWK